MEQTTATQEQQDPLKRFLEILDIDRPQMETIGNKALQGADDGEIFFEHSYKRAVSYQESKVKGIDPSVDQGYGIRLVTGTEPRFTSGNTLTVAELLKEAAKLQKTIPSTHCGMIAAAPESNHAKYYDGTSPFDVTPAEEKKFLDEVNNYIRSKDARVREVQLSIGTSLQEVCIVRVGGMIVSDVRPLTRIGMAITIEQGGRREQANESYGGRAPLRTYLEVSKWKNMADSILRDASDMLLARPCPSGAMSVVLGNASAGILLHEAIGHPMEGDAVREGTSVFKEFFGKQIAAKGVTVVDDGTVANHRGSLNVDDEGTKTQCTTLIEDGKLVAWMLDRLSGRELGYASTGNGRRQSYEHRPLVRMTNTYMLQGDVPPEDIFRGVKKGVYFPSFDNGQVDPVSGKFVFKAELGYVIEDGAITYPVKGPMLTGTGYDVLRHIDALGKDFALDSGSGTCGKGGQGVPVGLGQPTMRISVGLTVGGTEAS